MNLATPVRDYDRGVTSTASRTYAPWVRIVGIIAMALAVSTAAAFLGRWQFHRYEVRADALHEYELGKELEPQAINDFIAPGTTTLPAHSQWREAILVGHFDAETTTVLRNRPVDSIPSWQYLVWFDTNDGRSMLVNLGWIPLPGADAEPDPVPYPTAETTITVIVRSWEDDDGKTGAGATRVNPAQVAAPTSQIVPGYGMLRQICVGDDCADTLVGEQTPLPSLSTGPHLSYAWQWWVLAAMSPVGAVIMIRREREEAAQPSAFPATTAAGAEAKMDAPASARTRRRPRAGSDEEVEDAL